MNFLTEYSDAVFERLILKLEVIAHAAKRSNVHQVRVHIKRIHSFLYLVNHTQAEKKLTEPAFLRKIFEAAGGLREIQVEIKLFREWKVDGMAKGQTLYNKWLELERSNTHKLQRAVNQPGQKTLELFHDKLDKRLSQLDRNKVVDFLKEKYGELQSGFQEKKVKRGKLHKNRKTLKNLLYILEAMDNHKRKLARDKKWMADLEDVLDKLGKWHDMEIAIARLEDFQKNPEPEFLAIYNQLWEKCKRIRRKYFKKAQKAASKLLTQDLILT